MWYRIALVSIGAAIVLLCNSAAAAGAPGPSTQPAKVRIGVYDSRAIVIAAIQSGFANKQMTDLQKQLNDAKAAGDTNRMEQIKAKGANLQVLRHLQAFSNAPVDDVLATVAGELPSVAQEAGVSAIVPKVNYLDDSVEAVDVTDKLVQLFHPNARTMTQVESLRHTPVLPMVDILGMKD